MNDAGLVGLGEAAHRVRILTHSGQDAVAYTGCRHTRGEGEPQHIGGWYI